MAALAAAGFLSFASFLGAAFLVLVAVAFFSLVSFLTAGFLAVLGAAGLADFLASLVPPEAPGKACEHDWTQ